MNTNADHAPRVTVIGGGLAGAEAAWQAARLGADVLLCEMRPHTSTPAHTTGDLAELVCSNSFRSNETRSAPGLLKEELRRLGSLLLAVADEVKVPAGGALAVSRQDFSARVTEQIAGNPGIELSRREVTAIPERGPVVIASGPLTSDALARSIAEVTGEGLLHFYDAIAPVIVSASIDRSSCFDGSRYEKGQGADYINCPLSKERYQALRAAMLGAGLAAVRSFEEPAFFERCLPIEELARRGEDTMRFGPLKPVGLVDPATGKRPYAAVQLRQDDFAAAHYNLVGFQTRMKLKDQERVIRLIPGLEKAKIARYGQIHRNTFIEAPRLLSPSTQLRERGDVLVAGQLSGVEGYIESIASGLVAGCNAARLALGLEPVTAPAESMTGALLQAVSFPGQKRFQPVKISFGLVMESEAAGIKGRAGRRQALAACALEKIEEFSRAVFGETKVP